MYSPSLVYPRLGTPRENSGQSHTMSTEKQVLVVQRHHMPFRGKEEYVDDLSISREAQHA